MATPDNHQPFDPHRDAYPPGPFYPPPPGPYGAPPFPGAPYPVHPGGPVGVPPEHGQAMTAMILGIVGLLCFSPAAPFAIWLGHKAMREIDASGGQLSGRGKAQAAFIMGIIGTVLLVLLVTYLIATGFAQGFVKGFGEGFRITSGS